MTLPEELVKYHHSGKSLYCSIPVEPWGCELWPLDQIEQHNEGYKVDTYVPGYVGFGSSGGGEMFAFSPSGAIVCLRFCSFDANEELHIADSWKQFEGMLTNAL